VASRKSFSSTIRITPERRTPQLIGIARARRLLVDGPEPDERVELVGQRHGDGDAVAILFMRHRVGRALGLVVQLDGAGDFGLGAGGARHSSGPSGPAARGTRRPCRRRDRPWQAARRGAHLPDRHRRCPRSGASSAMRSTRSFLRAELLVERDARELARHLVERLLQILIPEELGVRQPRADHLLVAPTISLPPSASRSRFDTSRKLVGELARLGIAQRKALLVGLHRRREHSPGTDRNASSNVPISTVGHSVRPAFSASSASSSTSSSLALLGQRAACSAIHEARSGRQQHLAPRELRAVVLEILDLERLVAVEAMAARDVSPAAMPAISNGTTLPSSRQTIECSGRTHWNVPEPQRCDYAQDVALPLGHRDHAARVEQVEDVARLDALVIGRQRQRWRIGLLALVARVEQRLAFGSASMKCGTASRCRRARNCGANIPARPAGRRRRR
jgi:hypothetical protein